MDRHTSDDKYYNTNSLNIEIHLMFVIFPVYPIYSEKSDSQGSVLGASLPPDASSFSPLALGVKLSHSIPAYSYWNFQFEQSEPGYIQFSFLIPRGSSIGKNGIGIKQTQHTNRIPKQLIHLYPQVCTLARTRCPASQSTTSGTCWPG